MRRVAFVGMDMMAGALLRLAAREDVELALCVTGDDAHPCGGVRSIARACGAPVLSDPGDDALVGDVAAAGATYLVTAAYHRKLPAARLEAAGVVPLNLHPSLLPEGRGPTPVLHFALDPGRRAHAGLTLHRMTERFDAGPMVLQHPVPLTDSDGYDAIEAKMFIAAGDVVDAFFDAPDALLAAAAPQEGGSYWRRPAESAWTAPVGASVADLEALRERMGAFGVRIDLAGGKHFYGRITAVTRVAHRYGPSALLLADGKTATVALRDGLLRAALF